MARTEEFNRGAECMLAAIKYLYDNTDEVKDFDHIGFHIPTRGVYCWSDAFKKVIDDYSPDVIISTVTNHIEKMSEVTIGSLTEEDVLELRDRYGDEVESVVRDMLSGKNKRWERRGTRAAMGG